MKRSLLLPILFLVALAFVLDAGIAVSEESGEALFNKHCTMCHPNGGNIINPKKTLSSETLKKNGIKTVDDIIKIMRNPKPGMLKFDEKKISDHDAEEIAEYILETFK